MDEKTPVSAQVPEQPIITTPVDKKMSKMKVAFLYVLIGGLIISALISVISILVGQFNEVVGKGLLTTFIFVAHSVLILTLVSADRHSTIGKELFPTTIFVAIVANMLTTTLSTWGVWDSDISWRAFLLYTLAIGVAFIATGALRLRVAQRTTNIVVYMTVALLAALTLALAPWVLATDPAWLGSFYYRLIAAISILGATSLLLSVIFNRIAVAQHAELRVPRQQSNLPGGLLAIYIVIGVIVGFSWMFGFSALIVSASKTQQPTTNYTNSRYDNTRYDYNYR